MRTPSRSARVALASLWLCACAKDIDPGLVFVADTEPTTTTGSESGSETDVAAGTETDPVEPEPDTDTESHEPDPEDQPHARAVIVVGELRTTATQAVVPSVSAAFIPDYSATPPGACSVEVEGCHISATPQCATACEAGQVCTLNDACQAVCQATCTLACGAGEECYFALPDVPGCKPIESFDGGTLLFEGTTVPITLYPPYVLPAGATEPLLIPGAEVTLTGSGAVAAGFEAFTATVTVSEPLVADLESITTVQAFGSEPLPLRWTAGAADDSIAVTLSIQLTTALGPATSVVECEAPDTGEFALPRAAVDTAIGVSQPSAMTVVLQRRHSGLTLGVKTKGDLLDEVVQPQGIVELVTAFSVSTSVGACAAGYSVCGDVCVNKNYDALNCGQCDNACGVGESCYAGACS